MDTTYVLNLVLLGPKTVRKGVYRFSLILEIVTLTSLNTSLCESTLLNSVLEVKNIGEQSPLRR